MRIRIRKVRLSEFEDSALDALLDRENISFSQWVRQNIVATNNDAHQEQVRVETSEGPVVATKLWNQCRECYSKLNSLSTKCQNCGSEKHLIGG